MYLYANKKEIIPLPNILPEAGYEVVKTFMELTEKNWLLLSVKQASFYEANPGASPEEVYNCELNICTPSLYELKARKIAEIEQADRDASVFFVNNVSMWLDKELRNSLLNVTLPALKAAGETTTQLWYEGIPPVSITVPVDTLIALIPQLELYAKQIYDNTNTLKAAVYHAETAEVLNAIEITDYPEHLTFTL